jgi:hypothetical protein
MISMMRSIFLLTSAITFFATTLSAQDRPTLGARPNLPGDLFYHIGLNALIGADDRMNDRLWRSFSHQFAYMYPKQIGNTNFSFNGGLGIAFENFAFQNGRTLAYSTNSDGELTLITGRADSVFGVPNVRHTKFRATFVELPIEFRWYQNKDKVNKGGFYLALGGFVGYRIGSFSTVRYADTDGNRAITLSESWQLNDIRAGATFRIAVAGFGAFCRYQFTPLFKSENSPWGVTFAPLTFGLTFDVF